MERMHVLGDPTRAQAVRGASDAHQDRVRWIQSKLAPPSRLLMQRCCYHLEVATGRQRRCIWRCVMLEHDQSLPAARESRWRQLCCRRTAPELATIIATMRCRVEHARGAQRLRGKRGRGRSWGSGGSRGRVRSGEISDNTLTWGGRHVVIHGCRSFFLGGEILW